MDIKTAYKVMYEFMDRYYWKREGNDIGSLLGSMSFLCNGGTADPATGYDWIDAAKKVKENYSDGVDDIIAYKMMVQFIKDYNEMGSTEDTEAFYDMIKLTDKKVDPKVWQDWLVAVESVKKDPSDDRFMLRSSDGKIIDFF